MVELVEVEVDELELVEVDVDVLVELVLEVEVLVDVVVVSPAEKFHPVFPPASVELAPA